MAAGLLLVISGPSGVGKGTINKQLLQLVDDVTYSISATTRPPRKHETDGENYFFLSKEEFIAKREHGDFLEWAEVYGNYYGTPRENVENLLATKKTVVLEIDTMGAMQIKKAMPKAVLVFILPPSFAELEKRLKNRSTETDAVMARRLAAFKQEVALLKEYDYAVVNEDVLVAAEQIKMIINAEQCRVNYILSNQDLWAELF